MAEYKVVEAEENGQKVCWSDLPQDILSIIFRHLFAKDSISFSSVCRSWRSYGVEFRQLPPPINQAPYLFSTQRSNQKCNFYYPADSQFYHVDIDNIPELSNAYIHHSNFGWLLMSTYDGALFFFNPFTKMKINLPEVPRVNVFLTMYFSSAPTSEDCLVVGLSCFGGDITVGVFRNGGQSWEFKGLKAKPHLSLSDSSPVFYRGIYYCLGAEGYVVKLNINNNGEWSCTVSTKPLGTKLLDKKISELVHQSFLLEVQGKLFGVFIYGDERQVRVYKLSTKYGILELVENLGDKILYVSPGLCFGEQAVVEGTGNKIYFPKFHGKNGVYYSLETKKYHSIAGDYSSQTSYNLQEFKFCSWIKPTFNSRQAVQEE